MKDRYGQILIQFRPQLVEDIEPSELLNQLLSRNVLTKRQTKSISCMSDPYRQNEAILDALHRRPDEDFDKFCDALVATNQQQVVQQYLKPVWMSESVSATSKRELEVLVEKLGIESRDMSVLETGIGVTLRTNGCPVIQQESSFDATITFHYRSHPQSGTPLLPNDIVTSEWNLANGPQPIDDIVVTPCSTEFYQQHRDQSYPLNRRVRGKCLLICNETFMSSEYGCGERLGADVDVFNLTQLFTQLQFTVDCRRNLLAQELRAAVKEVSNDESLYSSDCFVMCVMSHGRLTTSSSAHSDEPMNVEVILGTDSQPVSTTSLLAPFADEYCAALRGKPRIIIFQACRGDMIDKTETDSIPSSSGTVATATSNAVMDENLPERPISLKDFIVGYPTQSGFRSFRNTAFGSWYINALTRVFAERACDTDVSALFRKVNGVVSKWVSNCTRSDLTKGCQSASIVDNLTRTHLFLFPGQPL